MNALLSSEDRIRHYLRLACRAERNGSLALASSFRRMAEDLAPAPALRRAGLLER